jgi:hypothetical protein
MAKFVFNPRQKDLFGKLRPLPKNFLQPPKDEMKELMEQFKKEQGFSPVSG